MLNRKNRASTLPLASKRTALESKYHGGSRLVLIGLVVMAVGVSLFALRLSGNSTAVVSDSTANAAKPQETQRLPRPPHDRKLSPFYTEFPSLRETLDTYEIVGLYFAAAWCPMSTTVTELLDDTFRATLISSEKDRGKDATKFTIVYVSSDRSQEEFDGYRKPGWRFVEFANVQERTAIKRHLKTCARREMEKIGITRRDAEIPHLTILRHGQVLTRAGIQDVKERGTTAISYWSTVAPHNLKVSFQ